MNLLNFRVTVHQQQKKGSLCDRLNLKLQGCPKLVPEWDSVGCHQKIIWFIRTITLSAPSLPPRNPIE